MFDCAEQYAISLKCNSDNHPTTVTIFLSQMQFYSILKYFI